MMLTITIDGVSRDYHVEYDDIISHDWNEEIESIADTVQNAEKRKF